MVPPMVTVMPPVMPVARADIGHLGHLLAGGDARATR
jgi:hypothetical protein